MFKEEMKKILRSPMKWVLGAVLLLNIVIVFTNYFEFRNQVGSIKVYNEYANQYEGRIDDALAEKFQDDLLTNNYADSDGRFNDSAIEAEASSKAYFYSDYWMSSEYCKAWNRVDGESEERPVSYEGIKTYVNNSENKSDSVYPVLELEYSMLSTVGEPDYYYNIKGIENITKMLTGGMISFFSIMIALMVIVNSSFSVENSSNMISIILSTTNGRKKIIKAKMIAVQIISFIWISCYYWLYVLLNLLLYDNLDKLSLPLNAINSFYMSPYNLNIGQYIIIGYIFYVIGGYAMTSILSILSVAIKNIILNFGVSLLVFLLPLFFPTNGVWGTIGILFPDMSMQANMLFQDMQAISILGEPILLCYIAPVISLVIGWSMYMLSYKVYLKRNIE